MAYDGPPVSPVDHSTTGRNCVAAAGVCAGTKPAKGGSGCHRSPAAGRPRAADRSVLTCTPMSSASMGNGRSAWSSRCVASAWARAMTWDGVARRPVSHVRYDSGDTPSRAANAACDWPQRDPTLTQRARLHDVTPCHRLPAAVQVRGLVLGVLQSANLGR